MKFVCTVLAALCFAATSLHANDEPTYRKELVEVPGYWRHNGYGYTWVAGSSYYRYVKAEVQTAMPPSVNAPDFWTRLAEVKATEKETAARYAALREAGFLVPNLYGQYAPGYAQNFGAQATTQLIYGQGSAQYQRADLFAPLDLNAVFQAANQHVLGAQRLGSEGMHGFREAGLALAQGQGDVARINATRDLAVALLQTVQGPSKIETSRVQWTITPGGILQRNDAGMEPGVRARASEAWKASATARCAGCHANGKLSGNFDVMTFPTMTPEQKTRVLQRLTADSPEKPQMPRKAGNPAEPGEAIKGDELKVWFLQ